MNSNEKTFVLGVGCQKGGTSWLTKYLRHHSSTKLGRLKEYHVFNALYVKNCGNWYLDAVKNIKKDENYRLRAKFIENTEEYFKYFAKQLEISGKSLTADITPGYAGLPEYAFREIKEGFDKRNIQTKVIFLMRDPFERVYSYCRKGIRNNKPWKMKEKYIEQEALINQYATWGCEFRTKYDITIKNLEKVFDKNNIYYGFYEKFFSDESIKNLTDFLKIPFEKGDYDKVVNQGQKPQTFNKEVYAKIIANHYRKTYKFIFDKFGEEFIRSIWKSSKYIIF